MCMWAYYKGPDMLRLYTKDVPRVFWLKFFPQSLITTISPDTQSAWAFVSRTCHFPQRTSKVLMLCFFQVKSTSIGWSLGYMLTMSNMIPSEVKKTPPMTDPVFAGLIFLFSAVTIVTVVMVFIILVRTCYWGGTTKRGRLLCRKAAVIL